MDNKEKEYLKAVKNIPSLMEKQQEAIKQVVSKRNEEEETQVLKFLKEQGHEYPSIELAGSFLCEHCELLISQDKKILKIIGGKALLIKTNTRAIHSENRIKIQAYTSYTTI